MSQETIPYRSSGIFSHTIDCSYCRHIVYNVKYGAWCSLHPESEGRKDRWGDRRFSASCTLVDLYVPYAAKIEYLEDEQGRSNWLWQEPTER